MKRSVPSRWLKFGVAASRSSRRSSSFPPSVAALILPALKLRRPPPSHHSLRPRSPNTSISSNRPSTPQHPSTTPTSSCLIPSGDGSRTTRATRRTRSSTTRTRSTLTSVRTRISRVVPPRRPTLTRPEPAPSSSADSVRPRRSASARSPARVCAGTSTGSRPHTRGRAAGTTSASPTWTTR